MVFDHRVKYNGKWYLAGEEIEEGKVETAETVSTDAEKAYTKTEINRMSVAELKALAKEKGVDGANDMTGSELKDYFIKAFKL